ncbi:MAG: hypothetical protein ACM3RP_09325 [Chitinophagales bacterium]
MALEESSDAEKDIVEEIGGLTFVLDKSEMEPIGPVNIQYEVGPSGEGFIIKPERQPEGACGSCSGSCG